VQVKGGGFSMRRVFGHALRRDATINTLYVILDKCRWLLP
jgi:hypothetical protein